MSNEIGSNLLTSINKGAYDVNNLAKVLAEADVAGPKAMIESKLDRDNSELNAINYLQQNLIAFNTYTQDLATNKIFSERSMSSTDESVVTASITGNAASGTYNIESVQLARAHTMLSGEAYASRNASIAEGVVSINGVDIEINSSNNTLEGLQNAINDSASGVSAAIINNAGQYQLMLTSKETGAASQFDVTGSLGSTLNFATQPDTSGQDAILKLNGIEISNSSNNFDELIDGISFNLKSAAPGVTQAIKVDRDTEAASKAIKDFVMVYNQMDEILKDMSSYNRNKLTEEQLESEEYEFYGSLAGSAMLRDLRTQIKDSIMGTLESNVGTYNSLAGIGIELDRYGQLSLDEAKLDNALATSMDSVAQLFVRGGAATDSFVNVSGGSDKTQEGNYQLEVTQLAEQAQVQGTAVNFDINDQVSLSGASFSLAVDDSNSVTINLADGVYSKTELADLIQSSINNNADIKASNSKALVSLDANNQLNISSERFGGISQIQMSSFTGMTDLGFDDTDDFNEFGKNIDGFLTMEDGATVNIGAYADMNDGRKFQISDYAVDSNGNAAAVRGLEFNISGGGLGDRGTVEFKSGFGSKIFDTVNKALEEEEGLIGQRVTSLNSSLDRLEENQKKLDLRYEKLEAKYQMQFSIMNQIMSQMQETQSFLTQTFNRPQNN